MNNITKGDLLRFVKSYEPFYEVKDTKFLNSIYHIQESCHRYFLHSYPKDHVLNEWEYNSALYNDNYLYGLMDLRPVFEKFHKVYLREQIINKILDES